MDWFNDSFASVLGTVFGAGGILYAVIMHFIEQKKYQEEVRSLKTETDLKGDEFWKNRYDVLNSEMKEKDSWWKERYDNLYDELQNERKLSNEIISNFRAELNDIREDYERQRDIDKKKYSELLTQYTKFREETKKQNEENMSRINALEKLVSDYERKLKK